MPPPSTHPIPPSLPLTLIVATTPVRVASSTSTTNSTLNTSDTNETTTTTRLGIGLKGTLPWPRIKADMSFFARATSRPPRRRISVVITRDQSGAVRDGVLQELEARRAKLAAAVAAKAATTATTSTSTSTSTSTDQNSNLNSNLNSNVEAEAKVKADPAKTSLDTPAKEPTTPQSATTADPITDAIVTPSLDAALHDLDSIYGAAGRLGKIYVIGGAEIYAAALHMQAVDGSSALRRRPVRVVMTNVVRKPDAETETETETQKKEEGDSQDVAAGAASFECDTFFPLDGLTPQNGWRSASSAEVSEWVGEEVSGGWREEGEVGIQMVGFERVG
ncbi:Dihydrofolate reductase [Penicillium alfredii]|uniref:Dihydrofolate reductase n=1 Tax=Penicillium alfredii TaxID=1506179 RepID=A0A9W9ELV8_9EURO|nr:Dihydrofolate reductase [Penicillium alfredii]KAJ5084115.1 Dihydrofolate reductase [Penicillium alfredii]